LNKVNQRAKISCTSMKLFLLHTLPNKSGAGYYTSSALFVAVMTKQHNSFPFFPQGHQVILTIHGSTFVVMGLCVFSYIYSCLNLFYVVYIFFHGVGVRRIELSVQVHYDLQNKNNVEYSSRSLVQTSELLIKYLTLNLSYLELQRCAFI